MMHAVHSVFKLQNPPEIDSVLVVCLICDFSFHESFSSKFADKLLSFTFKNVSNSCRHKNDFLDFKKFNIWQVFALCSNCAAAL